MILAYECAAFHAASLSYLLGAISILFFVDYNHIDLPDGTIHLQVMIYIIDVLIETECCVVRRRVLP